MGPHQDHWLPYGVYIRSVYQRMYELLHNFAKYEEVETLMHEACRLAKRDGYIDANAFAVLTEAKFPSQNLVQLGGGEGNSYLSNIWQSSQSLSGVARTQATAYKVRQGLQGVIEAYQEGRKRRLGQP